MRCKVDLTVESDRPFWIKRDAFMARVDRTDLACRDSQRVEDYYLAEWFHSKNGEQFFTPPAFYLRNGWAFFINGRHRTILLSRHLELMPMSLTEMDRASKDTLSMLVERELHLEEVFILPDLPIKAGQ